MHKVNIFIHRLRPTSLSIAKKVRAWNSPKVRLWTSIDDLRRSTNEIVRFVQNWRDSVCIDQNIQLDHSLAYYEWDSSDATASILSSDGLVALLHRCQTQKMEFVVLGESAKCKDQIICFSDAPHRKDLPNLWCRCQWVVTYEDLFEACRKFGVFDFDLSNPAKFRSTNHFQQGARVYEEIETGHFVYLDMLHKDHYEVFDSNGKHLGKMSMNGNLDRSTADRNKHL